MVLNADGEMFTMNAYSLTQYYINMKDLGVWQIKGFNDDFLGIKETFNPWKSYISVNGNFVFRHYSSFELKELIAIAL